MKLDQKIKYVVERHVDLANDRFLLAVSGGKDSMVLFHIFDSLGLDFVVAHMNYGLREADADKDEALVGRIANERKVRFISKGVDTKAFCEEGKHSIQEGARILRHSWFDELLEVYDLQWVVTAHHAEDNKETFIQNLKRGSGLRGLKSMKAVHGRRFKPMLKISRAEIDEYVLEHEVEFRQDASNNKNHYQRNLIRNKLLPEMEEILPGIGQGITSSITKQQLDYDYLLKSLERDANQVLQKDEDVYIIKNYKLVHPRLLFYVLERFGFNVQQVEDIIRSKVSGKLIKNDSYQVQDGHGDLYVFEKKDTHDTVLEIGAIGEYQLEDTQLKIQECARPKSFERNKDVAYMDADKLKWPVIIRNYRHGDKIKPIGMKGSKKLSDYFTDNKIPTHERAMKKVVISGGTIVWLVGEVVSDEVKLTRETKKILKFETLK